MIKATTIFFTVLLMLSCSKKVEHSSETPTDGLKAIISHFEKGDFNKLIRERYAEIGKAENEEQVKLLVSRYKKRFSDEATFNRALESYDKAVLTTPELSDNGTVATFKLNDSFIKLSKMSNNKWGFHL